MYEVCAKFKQIVEHSVATKSQLCCIHKCWNAFQYISLQNVIVYIISIIFYTITPSCILQFSHCNIEVKLQTHHACIVWIYTNTRLSACLSAACVRECVWSCVCVWLRLLPLVSWWEAEQLGAKQLSPSQNLDVPVVVLPTPHPTPPAPDPRPPDCLLCST